MRRFEPFYRIFLCLDQFLSVQALTLEKKLQHNGEHPKDNGTYLKKETENIKNQAGLHAIEKEFNVNK